MIERRFITNTDDIETRAETDADGKRTIMGYFALIRSDSVPMWEWINGTFQEYTERISPDAFKETDISDVVYLVEHNQNRVVARTGANLKLEVTEKGIFARATIPAAGESTSEQEDLVRNVSQRIIRANSFAFTLREGDYEWYRTDGKLFRDIKRISKIHDLTSTLSPAYPETWVAKRTLNENEIVEKPVVESPEVPVVFDKSVIDLDFEFSLLRD